MSGGINLLDTLVYIVFSCFEGLAIFYYAFSIFRLDLRGSEKETFFTIIAISIATYFYHESTLLSNVSLVLNIIALVLFLIFLFRLPLFHALLISVLSFVSLLIIQGLTTLISGISLDVIMGTDWIRYSFQSVTDIILFTIGLILKKRTFGFTFVPTRYVVKFKPSSLNVSIFVVSILALIVIGVAFNLNLYIGTFFWIVCFAGLIFLGINKEMSNEFD